MSGLHHYKRNTLRDFNPTDFNVVTRGGKIFHSCSYFWAYWRLPWPQRHLCGLSSADDRCFGRGRRSSSHNPIRKYPETLSRVTWGPETWCSSVDPFARHRVIKVIAHLVYQVKHNDLQQLKARISGTVATVTHGASEHVKRGRMSSRYLSSHQGCQGVPTLKTAKLDNSHKRRCEYFFVMVPTEILYNEHISVH